MATCKTTRALIQSHWRGELDLWTVFLVCPAVVLSPIAIALPVAMLATALVSENGSRSNFTAYGEVVLALLMVAGAWWWCWGVIQTSMRLLSSNRLLAAACVFGVGCIASGEVLTEFVPLAYGVTQQVAHDFQQQHIALANIEPSWTKKPWTVVAQPELHRLIASGRIGWGSAKALQAAIDNNPDLKLLELQSFGGLVHEEDLLVDLVQKHQLDTLVLGKCASACTGVFVAGANRYLGPDAKLGFHQAGFYGRDHDTVWATPEYEASILMRRQGVAEAFMQRTLETSYYDLWRPHPLDVKRSGFATAWWTERPAQYR